MTKQEAKILLNKYNSGAASAREVALLQYWFIHEASSAEMDISEAELQNIMADMRKEVLGKTKPKAVRLWPRIAVAAAAVVGMAIVVYFYTSRHPDATRHPELVSGSQDIGPGKNTATLSLAGGKSFTLSDAHTGVIIDASQIKYNDGSLVNTPSGVPNEMTVTTPRGGTYQITLPDGTKVWLNAASRLTYFAPLNERGGVRKVELIGEAYFEVFRNKLQPFVVNSKKMELTVLGTHFNVNAYGDESNIKATLLEGSVRVRSTASPPVTLKPNQQAVVKENSIDCILVDAAEAIAWKNGEFKFRSQRIADIMRNVKRWYDVDVVFENNSIAEKTFTADISRYDNISKLLDILQKTGKVKFRIEGRTVYVNE